MFVHVWMTEPRISFLGTNSEKSGKTCVLLHKTGVNKLTAPLLTSSVSERKENQRLQACGPVKPNLILSMEKWKPCQRKIRRRSFVKRAPTPCQTALFSRFGGISGSDPCRRQKSFKTIIVNILSIITRKITLWHTLKCDSNIWTPKTRSCFRGFPPAPCCVGAVQNMRAPGPQRLCRGRFSENPTELFQLTHLFCPSVSDRN